MKCGPKAVLATGGSMPPTTIKADGTFLDDKPWTVRYTDGSSERFRVRFEGRFLADGVVGTLRARMQTRKKGNATTRATAARDGRRLPVRALPE